MVKFPETESRMEATRAGGGETGSQCLMETEFQFGKMKRVLEMNDGDNCTTL